MLITSKNYNNKCNKPFNSIKINVSHDDRIDMDINYHYPSAMPHHMAFCETAWLQNIEFEYMIEKIEETLNTSL